MSGYDQPPWPPDDENDPSEAAAWAAIRRDWEHEQMAEPASTDPWLTGDDTCSPW